MIVECIKQIVQDESGYAAVEKLKRHVQMYFGKDDENSTVTDEARAAELVQAITKAAGGGQYTAELQSLIGELNRIKAVIAEKKSQQTSDEQSAKRINEILESIDKMKDNPMEFDNESIRKIISCIKVMSKDEILIIFKGGIEKRVTLR